MNIPIALTLTFRNINIILNKPYLKMNQVVFGNVVDGMDVVDTIEGVGSQSGATSAPVMIKACGEITE